MARANAEVVRSVKSYFNGKEELSASTGSFFVLVIDQTLEQLFIKFMEVRFVTDIGKYKKGQTYKLSQATAQKYIKLGVAQKDKMISRGNNNVKFG